MHPSAFMRRSRPALAASALGAFTTRVSGRAAATRWPRGCWRLAALSLAAALLAHAPTAASSPPDIRPFEAQTDPIAAHRAQGNWTLVMFWSVTCTICAAETPTLSTFHEEQRGRGVNVLGVSIDGAGLRDEVARWMGQHRMRFPTLLGELSEVAGFFSAATGEPFRGTPSFMMFNPQGQLVGVNVGPVRPEAVREFIARKQRGG